MAVSRLPAIWPSACADGAGTRCGRPRFFQRLPVEELPRPTGNVSCFVIAFLAGGRCRPVENRPDRFLFHVREHGVVSRPGAALADLEARFPGGERGGQLMDGAIGGLDERDVPRRQCGRRVRGEPVLGEGQRPRTDDFLGWKAVSGGGVLDQVPLGVGERDRARRARFATAPLTPAPRFRIFSIAACQRSCSLVAAVGSRPVAPEWDWRRVFPVSVSHSS